MQAFSFIPNLGMTSEEFWKETGDFVKKTGTESTLAYLHTMIKECKEKGIDLTKEYLHSLGKSIKFYEGVLTWFKRLNQYADSLGLQLEQYLFRICKGVTNLIDDKTVNQKVNEKHVEFRNMIYLGDGITDIPCMTLIKEKNGKSIAVYQPQKKDIVEQLLLDNRVNYVCKSDFKSNSTLEKLVKLILDSISISEKLLSKENSQYIN